MGGAGETISPNLVIEAATAPSSEALAAGVPTAATAGATSAASKTQCPNRGVVKDCTLPLDAIRNADMDTHGSTEPEEIRALPELELEESFERAARCNIWQWFPQLWHRVEAPATFPHSPTPPLEPEVRFIERSRVQRRPAFPGVPVDPASVGLAHKELYPERLY